MIHDSLEHKSKPKRPHFTHSTIAMDNRQNSDAFKMNVKQVGRSFIPQNAEEALRIPRSVSPESWPMRQLNVENVTPTQTPRFRSQVTEGSLNVHTPEMSGSPWGPVACLDAVPPEEFQFPVQQMDLHRPLRSESPQRPFPHLGYDMELVTPPSHVLTVEEFLSLPENRDRLWIEQWPNPSASDESPIPPLQLPFSSIHLPPITTSAPSSDHELSNLLVMEDTLRHRYVALVCRTASSLAASWGTAKKFSERFSALWGDLEDRTGTVWFCIMDGEHSVFALRSMSCEKEGETEEVKPGFPCSEKIMISREPGQSSAGKMIKCLNLPSGTIPWSTLLQSAADFMDTDNQIRAVLAACIVSARAEGRNSCVSDAIVPEIPHTTRYLSTLVNFDVPVDYDLATALANPVNIKNELYFKCDLGTIAKAVGQESSVCHLERIVDNQELLNLAEQQHDMVVPDSLPILYGFGKFLETEKPRATTQIDEILRRLSFTAQRGGVSRLLRAIVKAAPTGNLDLLAAAGVLFATQGTFLGTQKTRKIRGDVLIVGPDGIYKSSRFRGIAVEGSLEVNLALIKLGMKAGRPVDTKKDGRISVLSEIAEHVLLRDYKIRHICNMNEDVVWGPPDLWSDETAVCNSLVALLCRKYGTFTGFSAAVSTPGIVRVTEPKSMEANIFLPALKVWQHARDLPDRRIWFAHWEPLSSKIVICGCSTKNCDTPPEDLACVRAAHVVVDDSLYESSQNGFEQPQSLTICVNEQPAIREERKKDSSKELSDISPDTVITFL